MGAGGYGESGQDRKGQREKKWVGQMGFISSFPFDIGDLSISTKSRRFLLCNSKGKWISFEFADGMAVESWIFPFPRVTDNGTVGPNSRDVTYQGASSHLEVYGHWGVVFKQFRCAVVFRRRVDSS